MVNVQFVEELHVDNRKIKEVLLAHFGDSICFTYPRDKAQSQMFYSCNIAAHDIAEVVRKKDVIKDCAEILKKECKSFDFNLDDKFCDGDDLEHSTSRLADNFPEKWINFFTALFNSFTNSVKRKSMVIFQIVYCIIHNGGKKTPLHISMAQTIHEVCRSKQLIGIFNRLGISMSYDEVERHNYSLCMRTVEQAGTNHVPVPQSISPNVLVQGAVDNFDHEENTQSGIGGTHDTVMVLFQNIEKQNVKEYNPQLKGDFGFDHRQRALNNKLSCQKLLNCSINGRGNIPECFKPGTLNYCKELLVTWKSSYMFFVLSRFVTKSYFHDFSVNEPSNIPSWSAANSARIVNNVNNTSVGFTPLLPYPATEYDTIYTCMKNFQDVLHQTFNQCGALWCDEGVYRLAKELQLLFPETFDNIFLGLGGFHMEKTIIACIGKYLQGS